MELKQNWKMNEKLEAQELQLFVVKNNFTDSLKSSYNSSKRSQLYSSRTKKNNSGEIHQQTKLMHTFGILLITFTILHGLTSLFTLSFYPLINIVFCAMVCSVVDKSYELRGKVIEQDNGDDHDHDDDDEDDNDWSLRRNALLRWKRIHLSVFVSYLLVRLCLLLLFGWSTSSGDALLKNFGDTPPPIRTLYIGKWSFTHVWINYLFSATQIGIFVNGCALLYVSYNMWQYLNEKTRENELRKGNNGVEQV